MLSLFPSLLAFQQIAPLLLRVTLGAVFLFWTYRLYKTQKTTYMLALEVMDFIVGLLLIIGLYTQLAAFISLIALAVGLIGKIKKKAFLSDGLNYYLILLIISLSLLFLGPGLFAFDLPL